MKTFYKKLNWCLIVIIFFAYSCKEEPKDLALTINNSKATIEQVAQSRSVTTIAGNYNKPQGMINGASSNAVFSSKLMEVVEGSDGSLYLNDQGNSVIRKVSTDGTVSTFAGVEGVEGDRNGEKGQALFNHLTGLDINLKGVLYFLTKKLDDNGWQVKSLTTDGQVNLVTSLDSTFKGQLAASNGDLFVTQKNDIYKYSLTSKCIAKYMNQTGPSLLNQITHLSMSKADEQYISFSLEGYLPTLFALAYKINDTKQRFLVDSPLDIFSANDMTYSSQEGSQGTMYYGLKNRLIRINLVDRTYEQLAGSGLEGGQEPPKDGTNIQGNFIQPKFIFLSKDNKAIYFTENNEAGRSGLLRKYTF